MKHFFAGILVGLLITGAGCTAVGVVGSFLGNLANQPPASDEYIPTKEYNYPNWVISPPDCVCEEKDDDVKVKIKL